MAGSCSRPDPGQRCSASRRPSPSPSRCSTPSWRTWRRAREGGGALVDRRRRRRRHQRRRADGGRPAPLRLAVQRDRTLRGVRRWTTARGARRDPGRARGALPRPSPAPPDGPGRLPHLGDHLRPSGRALDGGHGRLRHGGPAVVRGLRARRPRPHHGVAGAPAAGGAGLVARPHDRHAGSRGGVALRPRPGRGRLRLAGPRGCDGTGLPPPRSPRPALGGPGSSSRGAPW